MMAATVTLPSANGLTILQPHLPTPGALSAVPTWAYISVTPFVQQVGVYVEIIMWLNSICPTAGGAGGQLFSGYTVNVTAPDGTTSTIQPGSEFSSQTSADYAVYTPTEVGNYTFIFIFPGITITNGTVGEPNLVGAPLVGDYYLPSVSAPATIQVVSGAVPQWVPTPLPVGYWQLPVQAENREWGAALASNWLQGGWLINSFQQEGQAPLTSHILWNVPIPDQAHGIVDAKWPSVNNDVCDYTSAFASPIIMDGNVYFNQANQATDVRSGYYCYNLYTGQQEWYNNGTSLYTTGEYSTGGAYLGTTAGGGAFCPNLSELFPQLTQGQLYFYHSINGQGVLSYLWAEVGGTWYLLDPDTGNWLMTLVSVPTAASQGQVVSGVTTDQDGALCLFSYNSNTGNVLCWNSSQAIPPGGPEGTAEQQWRPRIGSVINAVNDNSWTLYGVVVANTQLTWSAYDILPRSGYSMNFTVSAGLPVLSTTAPSGWGVSTFTVVRSNDLTPQYLLYFANPDCCTYDIGSDGVTYAWCIQINYGVTGYSPEPNNTNTQNNNLGESGTILWNRTYAPFSTGNYTYTFAVADYNTGIWTVFQKEVPCYYGFSLTTGAEVWGPSAKEEPFAMYGDSRCVANGVMYTCGYEGQIYAYNLTTGALIWTYTAPPLGVESPFGNFPLSMLGYCDGMVFIYDSLIYSRQPLWRGTELRAVNATTGTTAWAIQDWNLGAAIADGYVVTGNQYNNDLMCIGMGPSATNVTVTPVINNANEVSITGVVSDNGPGVTCWGTNVQGTPAVSDGSQQQWMQYLYEQQAEPANTTGVPVTLTYVDPNQNTYTIGTTTTNGYSGAYQWTFSPTVPGTYTVIATFCGTNSYGPSSAETSFVWDAPPAATAAPTATPTSVANMYFVPAIAGLFVLIIIVAIVLAILMLRKKP